MVIKIKEHNVNVSFGLYFLGQAQREYDTDLAGLLVMLMKSPIANMVDLMWFCAKCQAELDEVELPIKKRDFVEHLEQTKDFDKEDGLLAKWHQEFIKSIHDNFLPENGEADDDVKKKLIGAEM